MRKLLLAIALCLTAVSITQAKEPACAPAAIVEKNLAKEGYGLLFEGDDIEGVKTIVYLHKSAESMIVILSSPARDFFCIGSFVDYVRTNKEFFGNLSDKVLGSKT